MQSKNKKPKLHYILCFILYQNIPCYIFLRPEDFLWLTLIKKIIFLLTLKHPFSDYVKGRSAQLCGYIIGYYTKRKKNVFFVFRRIIYAIVLARFLKIYTSIY